MIEIKEYRGHIRNWKALCEELSVDMSLEDKKREREIVVKAYEKWGRDIADHLYGMFAFSLWDTDEKKLFCCRDHFGTKPFFYYVTDDNRLLCGSSIRKIMSEQGFKKELNTDMLQLYLSLTYAAGEDTFFKGLKKLMPGHWLEFKDGKLTTGRYWTPTFCPDESKSLEDWADEIHSTVQSVMKEVKT